ncbi:MAG: hypothetical protein SFX19_05505 [Alphaproteobacteria bacterium]|nr:hypothetical protein [Alphaproteobacteria bacterium]
MNREELLARIKSDTRTKEQLFECLVQRMKVLSPTEITDGEAAQAARRLIGFCQTILQSRAKRSIDSNCNADTIEDGADDGSGVSKPRC